MRLPDELGGCFHLKREMGSFVVIVIEIVVSSLLGELLVGGLERRVAKLLAAKGLAGAH